MYNMTDTLAQHVRHSAYADYLCALALPPAVRTDMLALMAFNAELLAIPAKVEEAMNGHIRYAWWREAVALVAEGKPARAHPVIEALAPLIEERAVAANALTALVNAHEERFANEGPAQVDAAFDHAASALIATKHPALDSTWRTLQRLRARYGHRRLLFPLILLLGGR